MTTHFDRRNNTMTIAKARFLIRSELERISRDVGKSWAKDVETAIQVLIDDAVATAIHARNAGQNPT